MKMKIICICILLILLTNCKYNQYSPEIKTVLKQAGKNREQIISALEYFQESGDSLKLDALEFLLKNADGHSYTEAALYDSNRVEIDFDILDFQNYEDVIAALDSLEQKLGSLSWKLKERKTDIDNLTADLLIENIEFAFMAWKTKPWAQSCSYSIFREYILPYRGSNEPLESWRIFFLDRYQELASRMSNPSDPLEAAKLINEDLKQLFGFDPRYYCHPTDQGLTEMLENNLGRCEDMTNIAIYAFRANGLPLTSDYTPHWADTSNNHAWNALITPSGEAIPMMGCEANPGEYSLRPIIAKVYRKTFSINEENLIFQLKQGEKAPPWLSGKNYCDVTDLYVATHDINLQVDPLFSDEDSFIYLCVFNSGEWKAIHWAELQNGKAKFTKMGTEICYLPMFYREEQLQPATIPFILRADGELDWIEASSIKDDLLLVSVTKKIIQASTDDKIVSSLQKDSEYELFYWNDRWESLGKRTADEKPLKYERVPGTALYWLVQCNSNKEERIFTYENNTQIWW